MDKLKKLAIRILSNLHLSCYKKCATEVTYVYAPIKQSDRPAESSLERESF